MMPGMDAETPCGDDAANTREPTAPSGCLTTGVATKSLGVSPRTIRWHIERRLQDRQEAPQSPQDPGPTEDPTPAAEGSHEATEAPERRSWWRRVFGG
jgi:hypothetical protein